MQAKLLLVTPPFSQLNTAYPATAYIKGFLESKEVSAAHFDLSIELFTSIFTSDFLSAIFQEAEELGNDHFPLIREMKDLYISRVDVVIGFLQKQDINTAGKILGTGFLPAGHRLKRVNTQIKWAAGELGVIDKAKHFSTLFIEEIGDFIQANVDEFFSFTKYAEQIATSAKDLSEGMDEVNSTSKQLATAASNRAGDKGQIRTLLGRLCRFDLWEPSTFGYNKPMNFEEANKKYGGMGKLRRAFTYKALNRLIQGSAADQTKKAMLDCYEAGLTPMLTVHDELCFNVEGQEQATQIKEIMETGVPLKVPSKIDVDIQDDWGMIE